MFAVAAAGVVAWLQPTADPDNIDQPDNSRIIAMKADKVKACTSSDHRLTDDNEMNAEESSQTDSFCSEDDESDGPIYVPIEDQIFYNDLIMLIIISYIGNFKDRSRLELASKRLRLLSRLCPYKPTRGTYDLLEATFQHADERLSVCIAGNKTDIPVLVASKRKFIDPDTMTNTQLPESLDTIVRYFDRVAPQIRRLRLGGLIHWEDVIGLLPNHQVVITNDLATLVVEKLNKVSNLCLRNACIDKDAVKIMLADKTNFRRNLTELCMHSIWFDDLVDCDKFTGAFLPPNLKSLHLSDCCNKMLNLMAHELNERGQTLDYCYMSLDIRSFDREKPPRHAFRNLIGASNRVAIEMRANSKTDYMFHALKDITRFDKVVWLELSLDKGSLQNSQYPGSFKRLRRLPNLETLRISGHGYAVSSTTMEDLCSSLPYLTKLREFVLRNATWHLKEECYDTLADSLQNLTTLGFDRCQRLNDRQLLQIVKKNPNLEAIHLAKCQGLSNNCVRKVLSGCRRLRALTALSFRNIDHSVYEAMADSRETPELRCASLCGHRKALSFDLESRLRKRFPVLFALGKDQSAKEFTYRLARDGYERYFDWVGKFGVCTQCRQYVSTYDDDSS